jgi:hypothetical protein
MNNIRLLSETTSPHGNDCSGDVFDHGPTATTVTTMPFYSVRFKGLFDVECRCRSSCQHKSINEPKFIAIIDGDLLPWFDGASHGITLLPVKLRCRDRLGRLVFANNLSISSMERRPRLRRRPAHLDRDPFVSHRRQPSTLMCW